MFGVMNAPAHRSLILLFFFFFLKLEVSLTCDCHVVYQRRTDPRGRRGEDVLKTA